MIKIKKNIYLVFLLCFSFKSFSTTKCLNPSQVLNLLLEKTKPEGIKTQASPDTIPLSKRQNRYSSLQYKVKVNYTTTDPTPSLSPLDRMDQLYQTSDIGIIPSMPKGYKFNPGIESEFLITDSNKFYQALIEKVNSSSPQVVDEVYLTSGGMNHVYLTHSNPLPSGIVPGTPEHLRWTLDFGENVMVKKVFKKSDNDGLIQAARMKSRDDAFYQLADSLTQKVTLDDKPFIRVAKGDLLQGTQEFVTGPTVLELRRAEEMLRYPDKVFDTKSTVKTKDQALKILDEAGFIKNGLPDLNEVTRQLASVEVFYKETHAVARELGFQYFPDITLSNVYRKEVLPSAVLDQVPKLELPKGGNIPRPILIDSKQEQAASLYQEVDHIQQLSPIKPVPKPVPKKQEYGAIGFDFNHGRNVIWSAKEKMFVIIDI